MKKFIYITIFVLIFSQLSYTNTLSLEKYLQQVVSNHPFISKSEHEYGEMLIAISRTEGLKDWNLFIQSSYGQGYYYDASTIYNNDSQLFSMQGSLSKLIPAYGTKIQIRTDYKELNEIPNMITGLPYDNYSLSLEMIIKQPLLKNAFGEMDRHPLETSKYRTNILKIKYREDIEDFIMIQIKEYLDWKLSYINLKIHNEQLMKAYGKVDVLKEQYAKNLIEEIDLIKARTNAQLKRVEYTKANQSYYKMSKIIKYHCANSSENITEEYIPVLAPLKIEYPSEKDTIYYLENESDVYMIQDINKQIQEKEVEYYNSNLKPELSLFASVKSRSAKNNLDDTLNNLGDQTPFTIGVEFKTALNNTDALKSFQSEQKKLSKIIEANNYSKLKVRDLVIQIYSDLRYLNELIKDSQKLLMLSKRNSSLELKNYNAGRSSLYVLLTTQDQVLSSELQIETLIIQKELLENQLLSLLDKVISHYNIKRNLVHE